ncbi:hypothetical protein F2Q69_00034732 [Brassica cretica]|uniref:Uncharacterized protein n=1 Tax=Brassica cretica TaxID=69181 RepID=A0A8S9SLJ9_BRACR|nr:hypothetical protein F2Q69_00034732 [Brassica cretica]
MHVYRTIADPKSRVEIVCAEQVVGVYARQAMMMLRNVSAYAACTAFNKLEAENRLSKHDDMTVVKGRDDKLVPRWQACDEMFLAAEMVRDEILPRMSE